MRAFVKYLLSGVSVWVLVDYTTAFNPDTARWIQHMPDIWLFYIGYPLILAYLIYVRRWGGRRLFGSMLVLAFIIEVILSRNSLLYTFPIMLIMNPVAIAIYSLVTYIPKWYTENEITRNRNAVAVLVVVWIVVSILNYATNVKVA
jgi:hypothetical protein